MAETNAVANASTKSSNNVHPHYFTSFQNYCCGPRSRSTVSPANKDLLPIPDSITKKAVEIVTRYNKVINERLSELVTCTSEIPHEFLDGDHPIDAQRYLVDRAMFKIMNDAHVVNWLPSLKKMYPIRTSGNGNCLLHAVLIAMIGEHDFDLHLRNLLIAYMDKNKEQLKAIWKTERIRTDKKYGIESEEKTLGTEWDEICDIVRYENSEDGQAATSLQFLEAVHVFSVSNMLARPIIILSEDVVRNKHGEAISPNDIFGIYLPTLRPAKDCVKEPIVLAYDQSHFCPLLTSEFGGNATEDNYLPLYQSAEHVRAQQYLPVKFLTNDSSKDQSSRLLGEYLRIRPLAHQPDNQSQPLSLFVAELGRKRISRTHHFFYLYLDYLMDFYENQCRRSKNEEEYPSTSTYEVPQSSAGHSSVNLLNGSPPPPYSQATARPDDRRPTHTIERRSSYDQAVSNGTSDGIRSAYDDRDGSRPLDARSPPKPTGSTQTTRRNAPPTENYSYSTGVDQQRSSWETTHPPAGDDLMNNPKSNTNQRGSNSKLRQDLTTTIVNIPIHHVKSNTTSAQPNLIDFDRRTDRIRLCIVCKRNFDDSRSTSVCPNCDQKMKYAPVARQAMPMRYPPGPNYPPSYGGSDFISRAPPVPKVRGLQKVVCPHCRNFNMVHVTSDRMDYNCSICGTHLRLGNAYG